MRSAFFPTAAAMACSCLALHAAVAEAINFQGVARRADGTPVGSQAVSLRTSIRQSTPVGAIAYQETHNTVTTPGGQFSIKLGQGTPLSGNFSTIGWRFFAHFLQIEIDPAGGSSFVDMGTQQLVSVPYALHAKTSDLTSAVGGTTGRLSLFNSSNSLGSSVVTQSGGFIGINNSSPIHRLDVGGGSIRSSSEIIAGTNITAGVDIAAGDDVLATDDISAGGTVSAASAAVSGNLTVSSGKGIVRSQNSTQLKVIRTSVTLSATLFSNSFVDSGQLFYEAFSSAPTVTVGACTTTPGEWYKISIIPFAVTPTSVRFRLFNGASDTLTATDVQWQLLIVGPQ